MADIQFDVNPDEFGRPPESSAGSDITGKFVEWGLAGNRQQAEYILISIGVIALAIAAFFIFGGSGGSSAPPLLPQ